MESMVKKPTCLHQQPITLCKRIGMASGYGINHWQGICRNQLPAAGGRRCSYYVDLVSPQPSCRQWGVRKQAGEFFEELHREGWWFLCFLLSLVIFRICWGGGGVCFFRVFLRIAWSFIKLEEKLFYGLLLAS